MEQYLLIGLIISIVCIVLYLIFRNPYQYPYKVIHFDISGRRNVKFEDELDRYLCKYGTSTFSQHYNYVQNWKKQTEAQIGKSLLHSLRLSQYQAVLDDKNMFIFSLTRGQTRYHQQNYVKTSYKVDTEVQRFSSSIAQINARYKMLAEIGFQCTMNEYHSKNQRKLMTPQLKEQIKRRDNYTCQICGKYMPDGVGLHIDHIIPVAKGGKSIPSNLQVLCSKCNGSKSSKI